MKKLFVLLIAVMLASASFSQSAATAYGFRPVMIVPDTSTNFPVPAKIGDLVYVQSTHTMYELEVGVGISKDMNWVLASASRYSYPSVSITGSTAITGTLSVSGASTLTGVVTAQGQTMTATHDNIMTFGNSVKATDTLFAPVVDATTKLIVGTQIVTVPHNNTATFNNSVTVTDTTFTPVLSVSGNATLSSNLTGNALIRDSVSFSTSDTRVAKKIVGALPGQIYVATPKMPAATGATSRPVAGDLLAIYPKTDSVIITRQAGTTSGLTVYFMRIK